MGVYIKGMVMPESCFECPCLKDYPYIDYTVDGDYPVIGHDYCCAATMTKLQDHEVGRMLNCPLVELPEKHGRLIDAEKLKNEYPHDTDWDYPVNTNCYVCESIDNAPTMIEAEGE